MPSVPAELHGIIQDNLDVDEAMRLRQSGMNLPLFLTDSTLDQTLQRYETHKAADSATSTADLETRTRLYNQHKKGWPCKQIIPDTDNVGEWPENTSEVLKGRFYAWETFGHESIRHMFVWDMLNGDFYSFPIVDDNIVNMTITEDLVAFVTPSGLFTITIEDMLKHKTNAEVNVHEIPRRSLRDTTMWESTLVAGDKSQIAVFGGGEIKLYDFITDKITHVATESDFTSLKQFSTNFVRVPEEASDTSSDLVLENGNIWLVYLKEDAKLTWDTKPRTRNLEIHRVSAGDHKSWNLTYTGAFYHSLRHLRIRSTGLPNQWQIRTAKQIILVELSDECKVLNVLSNDGTYVWKDKVYHTNRDTILISQLQSNGQTKHLASIKGPNESPDSSQNATLFVNETYMVRSMHYGYFDPHDDDHEIRGFCFDQMAEPKDSLPLTKKKGRNVEGDFYLADVKDVASL